MEVGSQGILGGQVRPTSLPLPPPLPSSRSHYSLSTLAHVSLSSLAHVSLLTLADARPQAVVPDVEGVWLELTRNVNRMCSSLTDQVRSIAGVTTAVARGDLTQKVEIQVRAQLWDWGVGADVCGVGRGRDGDAQDDG